MVVVAEPLIELKSNCHTHMLEPAVKNVSKTSHKVVDTKRRDTINSKSINEELRQISKTRIEEEFRIQHTSSQPKLYLYYCSEKLKKSAEYSSICNTSENFSCFFGRFPASQRLKFQVRGRGSRYQVIAKASEHSLM